MRHDATAGVALAVVLAWPVGSHVAALAGRPDLMPALTAVMGVILLTLAALRDRRARVRCGLAAAIAAVVAAWWLAPRALLFAAPAALAATAGLWFASSLTRGREPRIATYARREQGGELPAEVAGYARRLTLAWAIVLFALAGVGLMLAALAPVAVWSVWTNLGSYAVIGAFFVAEYLWRRVRFPDRPQVSFLDHLRNVIGRR